MDISQYLSPDRIFLDKVFDSKEDLLKFLLEKVANDPAVVDLDEVRRDLFDREAKGGTALEDGLAVPHARTNGVRDIVMAFVRLGVPLDLGSADGGPSRFVFLILVPKEKVDEYLEVLGHIARIMKRPTVRERLIGVKTPDEVFNIFKELEVKG